MTQPEVLADHRRALDVPARPSASPGAWPAGQFRRGGLPEDEVLRVLLVRGDFDPGTVEHVFQAALRQRAVFRVRGDVEQHVPVCGVGVARVPISSPIIVDDLVDVVGGARLDVRRRDTECCDIAHVLGGEVLRVGSDRRALGHGLPR